ncbi:MAG: hypothetical protein ACFFDC_10820 [Promethearchaeota archaeon]
MSYFSVELVEMYLLEVQLLKGTLSLFISVLPINARNAGRGFQEKMV